MKRIVILAITLLGTVGVKAQELNCQVSIITDVKLEVTTVEQEIFKELEQNIFDLMNTRKWTNDNFEVEERINCNIEIQINSIPSQGTFSGFMQVQSSRPAFNSSYNTTVFNFQDEDITFSYSRGDANFRYAPNQMVNNLTSILAFYAYFIIGMDYDTFSMKGGTKYFNEAQQIVAIAQTSPFQGWKSNETGKRNRYWLVDNIQHELFTPLRECSYEYHRKGIDQLYENKETARNDIYKALNKLVKVAATRPNSMNLTLFVQGKSNELKNLYEDADLRQKNDIVNLMKRLDPGNSSKYQQILE